MWGLDWTEEAFHRVPMNQLNASVLVVITQQRDLPKPASLLVGITQQRDLLPTSASLVALDPMVAMIDK